MSAMVGASGSVIRLMVLPYICVTTADDGSAMMPPRNGSIVTERESTEFAVRIACPADWKLPDATMFELSWA